MSEGSGTGEVDLERPNAARVYDYWLGGAANFAIDRDLGDEIAEVEPRVVEICRANRAFLARVVNQLVSVGVRQFLDLGSGVPTVGNVHEIAQQADSRCRVAYVDVEPVAVAHSRHMLIDNPLATITQADLRQPEVVLSASEVSGLLDFEEPVAVLALMVLQYFPDTAEVTEVLTRYRAGLAGGGYLAISHLTSDAPNVCMGDIAARTKKASTTAHPRDADTVRSLFGDCRLVEPGLVWVEDWRPHAHNPPVADPCGVYAGVGTTVA